MSLAGRPSERRRRGIATGGRPRKRSVEAVLDRLRAGELKPGSVAFVGVYHDDYRIGLDGEPR